MYSRVCSLTLMSRSASALLLLLLPLWLLLVAVCSAAAAALPLLAALLCVVRAHFSIFFCVMSRLLHV